MSLLDRFRRKDGSGNALAFFRHDLSIAFVGHTFSKGLGFLTYLVIARRLHPAELALIGLSDAVMQIAFQVSELGLETGLARFVSKGIRTEDEPSTEKVLRAVFLAKLLLGSLVFLVCSLGAPLIALRVLEQPQMTTYLRVALIGIYGMHLSGFYQAYFSARLDFARNAFFITLTPLVIFVAVAIAWLNTAVSALTCVWIYAVAPVAVWSLAALFLPHRFLGRREGAVPALRSVWQFSRWVYVTGTLGEVRFRLASILLARLASPKQVGLYYFADKLASTLTLFTSTILTVFVPRASHLVTHDEIKTLLRQSYRWIALLLPPLLLLPFLITPLFAPVVPRYTAAVPYFVILFISVLFSLAALPARTVLYSLHRPEVATVVEAIALAVTGVAGYLLVKSHGALGACLAMLAQRILSSAIIVGWVYRKVYRGSREDVETASLAGV